MNLSTLPDRRAEREPDGPAVSDSRRTLTNAEFFDRVRAYSNHLYDRRIRVGDVVAVKLRNRAEFVVLLFAAWRLGAADTPVNPSLTDDEVTRQLADSGAHLLVIDDNARIPTAGTDIPVGEDGEVLIAGPNVMRGYLGRPQDTARTVVDGWLRTGDIGHVDADGYLTLAGRCKDMIIRGGENIYPKEIEDVLVSDPTVLETAVVGAPDDKWGEVVVAYVAPREGATIDPDALQALCARSLAGYKRPTKIVVVDAIPKNAVGKTDKAPLRAAHTVPAPRTIEESTQ